MPSARVDPDSAAPPYHCPLVEQCPSYLPVSYVPSLWLDFIYVGFALNRLSISAVKAAVSSSGLEVLFVCVHETGSLM